MSEQLMNLTDYAQTKENMLMQVKVIQDTLQNVMKEGEHYGKIPGCGDKPSLLKPGAEKIGATFHLAPSYDVKVIDLQQSHREYQIVCKLTHIITGSIVGEGVGSCSTMEGKFRYRTKDVDTGEAIPKDYKENKGAYRAKGFKASKNDEGKWIWCKTERIEHDNPADYYNTCLKMAKKRAHVDAVLTATAASDIFTQDVEDMPEVFDAEYSNVPQQDKPKETEPQKEDIKTKLHEELSNYCRMTDGEVDEDMYKTVCTEVSTFSGKNKKGETVINSFDDPFASNVSDKWAGAALGKLRKKLEANNANT